MAGITVATVCASGWRLDDCRVPPVEDELWERGTLEALRGSCTHHALFDLAFEASIGLAEFVCLCTELCNLGLLCAGQHDCTEAAGVHGGH